MSESEHIPFKLTRREDRPLLLSEAREIKARVALLERALEQAAAALTMAHMARTEADQMRVAEAREYVLFTVMPTTGVSIIGSVWDAD